MFYKQEWNSLSNVPAGKTAPILQPGSWGMWVNNLIQSPIFNTVMKDSWIVSVWTEDRIAYF